MFFVEAEHFFLMFFLGPVAMDNAAYILSRSSISIKLWPPSDNTRKMLVEKVTSNLSIKSIFTEKY